MSKEKLIWHTEKRKINDLIPYEGNPRQMNQKQKEDLEESLKRFNLMSIPVVNTDNIIVSGHQRLKILQLLDRGEKTIDVRIPNRKLTSKELREANLRENKNLGSWDYDLLANIDKEVLLDVGFTEEELDDKFNLAEGKGDEDNFDVDKALEEIKKPICKREDIWQLGEHRLMCGDATVEEDVKKLMDGKKIDLLLTDPPYGVDYRATNNKRYKKRGIKGDKPIDYQNILKFIPLIKLYLKNSFYICGADKTIEKLIMGLKEAKAHISCLIIYAKDHPVLGMGDYNSQHEFLVYGWFCDKHIFYGDHTQKTLWEIKRPVKSELHPTQKPIDLCVKAINNSSKINNIVADYFGGSGSTLIACEQINRICYMMEIDPIYCDVIIRRWENYTDKKAVNVNGNKRHSDRRT